MEFRNDIYTHPSYRRDTNTFLQIVRKRDNPLLVKVLQYDFPDTASFGGCILDPSVPITEPMEIYAELIMLLFHPFRTRNDILKDESHVTAMREAVSNKTIGESSFTFLQNLQDAKSNCFGTTLTEDDLQRHTSPIDLETSILDDFDQHDEEEDENNAEMSVDDLDQFLTLLDMENSTVSTDDEQPSIENTPREISFKSIRDKGKHACGYHALANVGVSSTVATESFVETEVSSEFFNDSEQIPRTEIDSYVPTQRDIVTILLTKTQRCSRSFQAISRQETPIIVLEANGSRTMIGVS